MPDLTQIFSAVFPTLSPASRDHLYSTLNLHEIRTLSDRHPTLQPEINLHYGQRYNASIRNHIPFIGSFSTVIESTCSFLSGPLVMRYIYPDFRLSDAETLDIYVKRQHSQLMLNHIRHRQGYTLLSQPPASDLLFPQYNSSCGPSNVNKADSGVDYFYMLQNNGFNIRIIVAASNISAMFPIPFFPLTVEMNILTPSLFMSLYPLSSLNYKGFISDNAYVSSTTATHHNRLLRDRSRAVVEFFIEAGFQLADHRDSGNVIDGLWRSTDDSSVVRIEFSDRQSFKYPDPTYPPVSWCLGGTDNYDCGITSKYHKFYVHTSL